MPVRAIATLRVGPTEQVRALEEQNRHSSRDRLGARAHRDGERSPMVRATATLRVSGASVCRVLLNREICCRGGETRDVHPGGLIRDRCSRLVGQDGGAKDKKRRRQQN